MATGCRLKTLGVTGCQAAGSLLDFILENHEFSVPWNCFPSIAWLGGAETKSSLFKSILADIGLVSMKSLHAFMADKGLEWAIRLDINPPSVQLVECKTTTGEPVSYQLISLPLYMVESIPAALAARMDH